MFTKSVPQYNLTSPNRLALFLPATFKTWLLFSKKIFDLLFLNNHLQSQKQNYKDASLIFIMKPAAS